MKAKSVSIPKFGEKISEDAVFARDGFIAVSDGAGGGGVYADQWSSYLVSNIPLFAISSVMLFLAFRNLRVRRKESIYFLVFTTIVLFLSVVCALEKYSQRAGLPVVGTIFTAIVYILRPTLLFVFVLLTNMDFRRERWFFWMLGIPLVVNSVLYTLPLFMNVEPINKLVFYYAMNDDGVLD